MMHCGQRCGCGMVYGACVCAAGGGEAAPFSIFFPAAGIDVVQNQYSPPESYNGSYHSYSSGSSPPSSYSTDSGTVDCTLSLGTPSTRAAPPRDGGAKNGPGDHAGGARRCANCGTASTPLWRNGPRGPKSLCNACGIRYKKEERRAAATAAAAATTTTAIPSMAYGYQQPWGCYGPSTATKNGSEGGAAADDVGQFYPWRINVVPAPAPAFTVPDRTSLSFQYY